MHTSMRVKARSFRLLYLDKVVSQIDDEMLCRLVDGLLQALPVVAQSRGLAVILEVGRIDGAGHDLAFDLKGFVRLDEALWGDERGVAGV